MGYKVEREKDIALFFCGYGFYASAVSRSAMRICGNLVLLPRVLCSSISILPWSFLHTLADCGQQFFIVRSRPDGDTVVGLVQPVIVGAGTN